MKEIPIFVINLDRATDRLEKIQELFNRFKVNFNRIPAIDGNLISDKQLKNLTNFYNRLFYGIPLSKTEIAIALSHKKIYQEIVSKNLEGAFIFEDDAVFDDTLISLIRIYLNEIKKWDFFTFGDIDLNKKNHKPGIKLHVNNKEFELVTLKKPPSFLHAYYASFKFAKYRLDDLEKILEPVDLYRFSKYNYNFGGLVPPISTQYKYRKGIAIMSLATLDFSPNRLKKKMFYILRKCIIKPIIFIYSIRKKTLPPY
jgi:glycosyl transferase family 25